MERATVREKCLAHEHNAMSLATNVGLEPGLLDLESSALTMRPLRLPLPFFFPLKGTNLKNSLSPFTFFFSAWYLLGYQAEKIWKEIKSFLNWYLLRGKNFKPHPQNRILVHLRGLFSKFLMSSCVFFILGVPPIPWTFTKFLSVFPVLGLLKSDC